MNIKQELKEFFGDRPLFYIKFTREERWAKDILEGKLFMNKIDYYRKLELNRGTKGQGDTNELKVSMVPLELTLIHNESNVSIPINASKIEFELNDDKNKPVFCITGLTIEDMIIDSYEENLVNLKFPYKKDNFDLLKNEFGEYAVILSPQQFESNISNALDNEGIDWIFGKVKYVHENSLEKLKDFSTKSPKRFLYKDLEFKYQKEYRLVLDENIESNKILSIGNLNKHIGVIKLDDLFNIDITLKFK